MLSNHVIDHDSHSGNDWKSHYILTWVVESGIEAIKLTLKIVPEEIWLPPNRAKFETCSLGPDQINSANKAI